MLKRKPLTFSTNRSVFSLQRAPKKIAFYSRLKTQLLRYEISISEQKIKTEKSSRFQLTSNYEKNENSMQDYVNLFLVP
jgi:hypothetical protein